MQTQIQKQRWYLLFLILFTVLFYLFIYTVLHEGGHALAGLAFGNRLIEFNVNFFNISAHVNLEGYLTRSQRTIVNIAGVGLPYLVWFVFMLLVPRRSNLVVEMVKFASSIGVINIFLVWIIFPLLALNGTAPSDDATNFLQNSGIHPLLMSATFLAAYIISWALFLVKTPGLRDMVLQLRNPGAVQPSAGARWSIGVMAGLMLLAGVTAFVANGYSFAGTPRGVTREPPTGYQLETTVDLSEGERTAVPMYAFDVEQAGSMGIFLRIENIDTTLFDVRLIGAGGYEQVLLRGEGYQASLDTVTFEEELPPDSYQLLLSSYASPGTLSVYIRQPSQ